MLGSLTLTYCTGTIRKGDLLSWLKLMELHCPSAYGAGRAGMHLPTLHHCPLGVFSKTFADMPLVLVQPMQEVIMKQMMVPEKMIYPRTDFQYLEFLHCSHPDKITDLTEV